MKRYPARELLRLMSGVNEGAAGLFGEQTLASEIAREKLVRDAYPVARRREPTVTFADDVPEGS